LRSRGTTAHVGIRLKVEYDVTSRHFLLESLAVEDVGTNDPNLRIFSMVPDEQLLTGAEIVIDDDTGIRLSKPINNVATDKAATSSYECPAFVSQIHIITEAFALGAEVQRCWFSKLKSSYERHSRIYSSDT
jgi:hypothetical protein